METQLARASSARLSVLMKSRKNTLFRTASIAHVVDSIGSYAAPRAATQAEMKVVQNHIYDGRERILPALNADYVIDASIMCEDNTLLYHAAKCGNVKAMAALIHGTGADVNQVNAFGESPIHIAAHHGHREAITTLVENCANLNAATTPFDWTPLMLAVRNNQVGTARHLLELGADANQVDYFGISPVWYAASSGNLNLVSLLVEVGQANIDFGRKVDGCTTKEIALRKGHSSIVAYLS